MPPIILSLGLPLISIILILVVLQTLEKSTSFGHMINARSCTRNTQGSSSPETPTCRLAVIPESKPFSHSEPRFTLISSVTTILSHTLLLTGQVRSSALCGRRFLEVTPVEALRLVSEMTLVAWNANAHRATKSQFKCQILHSAIRHDKCRASKKNTHFTRPNTIIATVRVP